MKKDIKFYFPPLHCQSPRIEIKPKGRLTVGDPEDYWPLFLIVEILAAIGLITVIKWILNLIF